MCQGAPQQAAAAGVPQQPAASQERCTRRPCPHPVQACPSERPGARSATAGTLVQACMLWSLGDGWVSGKRARDHWKLAKARWRALQAACLAHVPVTPRCQRGAHDRASARPRHIPHAPSRSWRSSRHLSRPLGHPSALPPPCSPGSRSRGRHDGYERRNQSHIGKGEAWQGGAARTGQSAPVPASGGLPRTLIAPRDRSDTAEPPARCPADRLARQGLQVRRAASRGRPGGSQWA